MIGGSRLEVLKNRRLTRLSGPGIVSLLLVLGLLAACGGDDTATVTPVPTQAEAGVEGPGSGPGPTEPATDNGGAAEPTQRPAITPGGERIAFASTRGTEPQPGQGWRTTGTFDIHLIDPDGTNQLNITDDSRKDASPDWSPDGSRIVFERETGRSSEGGPGTKDVFIMNSDGSEQTNLTDDVEADYREPDWSPDGARIAFFTSRDRDGEIYVMNPDGSGLTRLTDVPGVDTSPNWSPDGAKIAFTSFRDGDGEVYLMNADGSNQTRLTDQFGEDGDPAWSPDGTKIAFVSERDGAVDVFVMDADGSNPVNLSQGKRDDRQPSWSPDGTKIAFWSLRDDRDAEVYIMDADGSNQTRMTMTEGPDVAPAWFGGS